MSTSNHTILASAQFGEFGRFNLSVSRTRYGAIAFFVSDAEVPGIAGAETIRVCDSLLEALNGLPTQSNVFRLMARPGDMVVNLGCTIGWCISVDAERGWLLQCPQSGQQWYADPARCWVVRDDVPASDWD